MVFIDKLTIFASFNQYYIIMESNEIYCQYDFDSQFIDRDFDTIDPYGEITIGELEELERQNSSKFKSSITDNIADD